MMRLLSSLLLTVAVSAAAEELYRAEPFTAPGLFTSGIEGPAVDGDGNIYCVKFGGEHTLGRVTPEGRAELFLNLPEGSTANGIRFGPDGLLYVADYTGHNILQVDPATKAVRVFAHEARMSQPNDLTLAADGTIYASDPDWKNSTGRIWRIDRAGRVTLAAEGLGTVNGIDLSPDGRTLYVNESVQRVIWSFRVGLDGGISDKREFARFADHGFDGMRVDVTGRLHVTRHGKGTVVVLSAKGEVLHEVDVLGSKPSNLCFGGPDGRTVYVTEMEHGRLVKFRTEQPGQEWQRTHERLAVEQEPRPHELRRHVAVKEVCAWPNLTLTPQGEILAVLHNQPGHGTMEGDIDCWASRDGVGWEKRSTITQHEPGTIRMNHAAGLAGNGDLIVLCSGWTDHQQPGRPKQAPFRDAVLSNWILRSADGGRSWTRHENFPKPEPGWKEYIPFGDVWADAGGALHVSCYQSRLPDPQSGSKLRTFRSWHFRSDDDGRSWLAVSVIGERHNETQLFPLGSGRWLAAARIEAMDIFRSEDDGRTWGEAVRVTERNEINGHLLRLQDGRLLLTYGVRVAGRHGVCAKFSTDDGRTWGPSVRLAVSYINDCGYPSSVQLADGRIITAYYSKSAPEYPGYHMGTAVWRP
jgi:sugar lactone lactonase YvrE